MTDLEKLRAFAQDVMRCWGGDLDGLDLQDMALEHGLLEKRDVTEPCSPDICDCASAGEQFPTTCMFRTALLTGTPGTPRGVHASTPEAKQ